MVIMAIQLVLLISFILPLASNGAKVLIYPLDCGFNSRLMNLVKIADILNSNGHNATVLVNTKVAKMLEPEQTKLLTYYVPNVDNLPLITDQEVLDMFGSLSLFGIPEFLEKWVGLMKPFCRSVLGTNTIHELKAEGYDLVITDTMWDCGRILVDYLDIPAMTYSNWGFTVDPFTFYPALPSFVCNPGSPVCSSDRMNFQERFGNLLQWVIVTYYYIPKIAQIFDNMKLQYNLNVSRSILKSNAFRSPVIVNGDFVIDYPRPVMPHVLMIPGLFHRPPKALPNDLLTFIEGSYPHGVVVVSFGSMVSKVDKDKAEIFANVLGELPQRVLWRYTGEKPIGLKNNTRLVSWFPQADVLGHPLTKMFVTHCGISGTYEAAMNALPVIAFPLFADQEYNSKKLVLRGGMGVRLNLDAVTESSFRRAVTEVMSNPKYLRNARHVSALLKDTEQPAKQKLLHWVDYVIRHNGARHLISETALSMSNYVFYSLDVVLVLLIVISIIGLVLSLVLCYFLSLIRLCLLKTQKPKMQ